MNKVNIVPSDFAVEFASPEWFDLYQKACIAATRMGVMPDGVTCEVYRDVPTHLSSKGAIAWTRRVVNGICHFDLIECSDDEAGTKIRANYAALLPLARTIVGADDTAFTKLAMEAITSGKMEVVRHDPAAPNDHLVHNLMAALTR